MCVSVICLEYNRTRHRHYSIPSEPPAAAAWRGLPVQLSRVCDALALIALQVRMLKIRKMMRSSHRASALKRPPSFCLARAPARSY